MRYVSIKVTIPKSLFLYLILYKDIFFALHLFTNDEIFFAEIFRRMYPVIKSNKISPWGDRSYPNHDFQWLIYASATLKYSVIRQDYLRFCLAQS